MKYVIQRTKFTKDSFDRKAGAGSLQVEEEKVYEVDTLVAAAQETVQHRNYLTSIAVIAVKEGLEGLPRLLNEEEKSRLQEEVKKVEFERKVRSG